MKNIKPCGWVQIKNVKPQKNNDYNCKTELTCIHQKLYPIDNVNISDIIIASFDIECDSLNGDFPQPIKTFQKLSSQLSNNYNNWINNFDDINISDESKKEFIKDCIIKSFESNQVIDEYTMDFIESLNGKPTIESIDLLLNNDDKNNRIIDILDSIEIKKEDLKKYYSKHDCSKVPEIDTILKNNKHYELLKSLKEKYSLNT